MMKLLTISSFLLFSWLFHLSLAQPRHRHGGRHRGLRAFPKRDKVTVTESTFPTPTEFPEVVVYVDQYGKPIRTATETVVYVPASSSAQSVSAPSISTTPPVVAPAPATPSAPSPLTAQSAPPSSAAALSSSASAFTSTSASTSGLTAQSTSASPIGGVLHSVTYSPYKGDGSCKTQDQVDQDFALFASKYGVIRLYGVDCDQVSTVYKAAQKYGNRLMLGIFDITQVQSAVATMAAAVDNDWSRVDSVSVGNELVNNGEATVGQSLAALSQTKSALRAAGYQGPVVIVDTFVAVLANPELCDQSDYCAVNIHPFFDANTAAPQAGSFLQSTVENIRSKLADPGKRIVVTETGWPWQGEANGQAVPGLDQQAAALASVKAVYSSTASDLFLFNAFNDMWKKAEPGTFMAEQFWGMGGQYSPCDQ